MIITRIFGGLGNQLFQYAAARALAAKHNVSVKLDVSAFENYSLRNFDLATLGLPVAIASAEEIAALKATTTFQRSKARLTPYPLKKFYKEPFFHFDPQFFKLPANVYLQGYFQSEKYFLPIQETLRSEFDAGHIVSADVKAFVNDLQDKEAVAVHIRRGDYKNEATNDVHGILPLSYYQKAIQHLREKRPNARFYLFTDDPEAIQKSLPLPSLTLVSGEVTKNHFEDLYAMSRCRHNIIANSSFSWWGAWLNPYADKVVIAPKAWFNKGPKDTQDLLPESWITL